MLSDYGFWVLVVIDLALALLGLIVYANGPGKALNRIFSLFSLFVGGWMTVAYLESAGWGRGVTNALVSLDFASSSIVLYLFLAFTLIFLGQTFKRNQVALITTALPTLLLVSASLATPLIISGTRTGPGGLTFITGPLFAVYFAYIGVYGLLGLAELFRKVIRSRGIERLQGEFVLLGLMAAFIITVLTNLVLPRLTNFPATVSQLGSYSIILFVAATAYAIVRHRLMDIRLVVARSVSYSLLLLILGGAYVMIFSVVQIAFLKQAVGSGQVLTSAVLALVAALTFQPLRRLLEHVTDGLFFRDRYSETELLQELGHVMSSTIILDRLTRRVLSTLTETMRVDGAAIIVRGERDEILVQNQGLFSAGLSFADVESLFHHHQVLVFDDLAEGPIKAQLRALRAGVAVPLETHDGVVGLVMLDGKKSGDPYSAQDLRVLEVIGPELAVAIDNARSYQRIERFNETLRLRVERATRKLREANSHLLELDKAKDEFISLASHQLRTPLTAVKGYLSMVVGGDVGALTPKQKEFVGQASEGAERMVTLIDDLLNVSRMDAGRFLLDRKPTDLAEVVDQEVRGLSQHAEGEGLKLLYHAPSARLPLLVVDETKTRQVVINFIDNAIYYTPKGEVTISLARVGGAIEFTVKDTGIGVAPEDQQKLFVKFYRAGNAKATRPDGTGLGLYLAKKVVEEQGGEIIFHSELGKGSTFGFRFPLPKPVRRAVGPAQTPLRRKKPVKAK